jgi:hypothetical protein
VTECSIYLFEFLQLLKSEVCSGRENGQLGTTTATSDSEEEEILFESSKKGKAFNAFQIY